jgi:hypothetical protein
MTTKKITFGILAILTLFLFTPSTTFAVFEDSLGEHASVSPKPSPVSTNNDKTPTKVDDESNLLVNVGFVLFGAIALTYIEMRTKLLKRVRAPEWMHSPWRLFLLNFVILFPLYHLVLLWVIKTQ